MELRMVLLLLHNVIFDQMVAHTRVKMLINMEHLPGIREQKTGGHITHRKSCAGWWINFFKDLVDNGTVDLESVVHRECLWFCFQGVLQDSLNKMKEYWNTHYIRSSRHKTIRGVPDILFYLPERSGGMDCLVPVSNDKIIEMEL